MILWSITENGKTISAHDESGNVFVILPDGSIQKCVNRYMTVVVAAVNGFTVDPIMFG